MTSTERFSTLVFDVLGTLLDEDAGMRRVAEQIVGPTGSMRFVADWKKAHRHASDEVRAGGRPYVPSEDLHAVAIQATAEVHGVTLDDEAADSLSMFGRELEPFGEVPDALEALARNHRLVALTNAGLVQAFEMSGFARLRWTVLLSSESVGTFKPDARMYDHAISALDLDAESCLFVAAHPWDLEAAAELGFGTAYVDRADSSLEEMADFGRRFDFAESDLAALATSLEPRQLARGPSRD